jgi:hypothetical protein
MLLTFGTEQTFFDRIKKVKTMSAEKQQFPQTPPPGSKAPTLPLGKAK